MIICVWPDTAWRHMMVIIASVLLRLEVEPPPYIEIGWWWWWWYMVVMMIMAIAKMMTVVSLWICGDALLTRWHPPPHNIPQHPWQLCHYSGNPQGDLERGTSRRRRKCILLQSQIETERESGGEGREGLDKHVLTPFYGGLYLRADPLGLCRLPLGCPGPLYNITSTDSISLLTNCNHYPMMSHLCLTIVNFKTISTRVNFRIIEKLISAPYI